MREWLGGKRRRDLHVPALCGALVAQGRAGGGMSETALKFGERGAHLGGQDGAGAAQVVKPQVRPTGGRAR